MSLSAWEQQALNTIRDVLAGSDPELAALLTTFSDLASGEKMPAVERIPPTPWLAARGQRHLGWAAAGLWLLITMALITIALILNGAGGGGSGSCPRAWVTACASPAPAHDSRPAT